MVRRCRRTGAIEDTLTVIATICFLPCICVIGGGIIARELFVKAREYERPNKRQLREARERKKEMVRSTPRRLAPRLERHLTIGRPESEERKGDVNLEEMCENIGRVKLTRAMTVTDGQEESGFFKLPLEIRRKIYEEVLGGHVIHIYFVETYRRMSHTRCKHRSPEICRALSCGQLFKVPGAPDEWGNIGLLPILQSCRRIYSEAIEMLYTENAFSFESLNDVLKLSLTLIPERIRLIKSVQWKPTVSSLHYRINTPWLYCRRPAQRRHCFSCCCVKCWPETIGLDEPQVNVVQNSYFKYPLPNVPYSWDHEL